MSSTLGCLSWMQNQNDQNPCTTAQEVGQLCNASYTVSTTNFQETNYVPDTTTANGCTCSWSIYNLISACSYCTGQSQYTKWSTWATTCGSHVSNTTYLPSGLTLSQGIPYWAATNPSTWKSGVFDLTQAADIAAADNRDVTGGPLPTSTASGAASSAPHVPSGTIVTSVIGALAIIVIGGLIVFFIVRRQRRQGVDKASFVPSLHASQLGMPPSTFRASTQPSPLGHPYTSLGHVSDLTSPVHSTANLALLSPLASLVSSRFTQTTGAGVRPVSDPADMISPFLAKPSQTNEPKSIIKGAEAQSESERSRGSAGKRTRLNPPPYSASVEPAVHEASRVAVTAVGEVLAREKKRKDSVTSRGATMISGHLRSIKESVTTVYGSPLEKNLLRGTAKGKSMGHVASGSDSSGVVEAKHGEWLGMPGQRRPPAI